MWRGHNNSNALLDAQFAHAKGLVHGTRPVIESGENMRMNINYVKAGPHASIILCVHGSFSLSFLHILLPRVIVTLQIIRMIGAVIAVVAVVVIIRVVITEPGETHVV